MELKNPVVKDEKVTNIMHSLLTSSQHNIGICFLHVNHPHLGLSGGGASRTRLSLLQDTHEILVLGANKP